MSMLRPLTRVLDCFGNEARLAGFSLAPNLLLAGANSPNPCCSAAIVDVLLRQSRPGPGRSIVGVALLAAAGFGLLHRSSAASALHADRLAHRPAPGRCDELSSSTSCNAADLPHGTHSGRLMKVMLKRHRFACGGCGSRFFREHFAAIDGAGGAAAAGVLHQLAAGDSAFVCGAGSRFAVMRADSLCMPRSSTRTSGTTSSQM